MEINVLYSCNQAYIIQTIVSIESLLYNNQEETVKIYVVQDQVEEKWLSVLRSRVEYYHQHLILRTVEDVMGNRSIELNGRHPRTIFVKLFAEKLTEDKLLYLDSDTVVTGSLKALFEEALKQESDYVAGVIMPYSRNRKQRIGLALEDHYVCDGVLLMDGKQWKEKKLGQRCITYAEQHGWNLQGVSETIINDICKGHIERLAPKYNLMGHMVLLEQKQIMRLFQPSGYYSEADIQEARKAPVIIHYLNELYNRPWHEAADHPYAHLYWKYLRMAGLEAEASGQKLGRKTYLTRLAFRILPFPVFAGLYHFIHSKEL